METNAIQSPTASKKLYWTGWVLSVLPSLLLLFSGVMKLAKPPAVIEGFTTLGYADSLALGLGITEIACTLVYLFPRTAILGAILLTGYLGGATATHLRVGDPFFMPIVLGVVLWIALVLRYPPLRAMIPWRRQS